MRSRGAFLLARIGESQERIGQRLGVTQPMIARWRSGERVPRLENRKLLLTIYGIPIEAWDEPPNAAPLTVVSAVTASEAIPPSSPVASATALATSESWGAATVSARAEMVERMSYELFARLATSTDATMNEHAKVLASLTHTLNNLRRLKGEPLPEVKLVRDARWIELRGRLLDALSRHPEALDDVIEALEDWEAISA